MVARVVLGVLILAAAIALWAMLQDDGAPPHGTDAGGDKSGSSRPSLETRTMPAEGLPAQPPATAEERKSKREGGKTAVVRHVVRGVLQELEGRAGNAARIVVVGLAPEWAKPTGEARGAADQSGWFEVDVTELFAGSEKPSELEVRVDHEDFVRATTRIGVEGRSGTDPGVRYHDATVPLVPAAIVTGRVIDEAGNGLAGATVGLHAFRDDALQRKAREAVKTPADGSFRLRAAGGGRFLVVALLPGRLPAWARVQLGTTGSCVLAPLGLEEGAVIEGTARFRDDALHGGALEATRKVEGTEWYVERQALVWTGDAVELATAWTKTDDQGRFRIAGLVRDTWSVAVEDSGKGPLFMSSFTKSTARKVTAPARGVDFELQGGLIVLEVRRHASITESLNAGVEGHGAFHFVTVDRGPIEIVGVPGKPYGVDVSNRAIERVALDLVAPPAGETLRETLSLQPRRPRATVVVRISDQEGRPIEKAGLALFKGERTAFAHNTKDVTAEAEVLRFPDVDAGRYLLVARAGGTWRGGDAMYLECQAHVDVPRSGEVAVSLKATLGGRLRIAARAPDGRIVGVKCKLLDPSGGAANVTFVKRTKYSVSSSSKALLDDVLSSVEPAVAAGRYRIEISDERWQPQTVEALVETGKTTNIDIKLLPR